MHGDGSRAFAYVIPIHTGEEAQGFDVIQALDPSIRIRAKSKVKQNNDDSAKNYLLVKKLTS